MATDNRVSFDPQDLEDDINDFQDREDLEFQSEAIRELLRVGIRETQSPLMYRVKQEVINWVGWLALFSIVVVVSGLTIDAVAIGNAVLVAVVLLSVAAGLLAVVEVVRALRGESELGQHLRGVTNG